MEIAQKNDLPVVIHDRDAHEDCFQILKEQAMKKVVFHCFSGDINFAEKVISEGWHISFTGTVTFKNSKLDEVIRFVPFDRFFVETDSPFLSPVPFRGKRNSPLNLKYIIEKIAELKKCSNDEIAENSYKNAERFFFSK